MKILTNSVPEKHNWVIGCESQFFTNQKRLLINEFELDTVVPAIIKR